MASLSRIVEVKITRATRTASRRSFGTVLIAAYHSLFGDRVREYEDPSEMLTDGFADSHAAYLAAVSLCSQNPRPRSFKIGRRAGTPDQTLRFTPSAPIENEVYSITIGGVTFAVTADATPSIAEITAALALLVNADPDAISASGVGSTTGVQNITTFNGIRAGGPFAPPRNATITFSAHADWDATTAVLTGLDPQGRTITENFAIPNGGGSAVVGTKIFASVSNLMIPAQSGAGGTLTMGLGDLFANANLDITATDGTSYLDVSADDAGAWFAYTGVTTNLAIEDRTAEPGTTLAVDLTAIQTADANWYGLVIADAQSSAQILAAAAWSETQEVIYIAHAIDAACEADVTTDVLSLLASNGYLHTAGFYSRANHGSFPDAGVFGAVFPLEEIGRAHV